MKVIIEKLDDIVMAIKAGNSSNSKLAKLTIITSILMISLISLHGLEFFTNIWPDLQEQLNQSKCRETPENPRIAP